MGTPVRAQFNRKLPVSLITQIRQAAVDEGISETDVLEVALRAWFQDRQRARIAQVLAAQETPDDGHPAGA